MYMYIMCVYMYVCVRVYIYIYVYIYIKKTYKGWIVNTTSLVLLSFIFSSQFIYFIFSYLLCTQVYFLFLFLFCYLMVFSQTLDWISTKPTLVGNCAHCSIPHSEEIKYIADNSLSTGDEGIIPKNKSKKNLAVLNKF